MEGMEDFIMDGGYGGFFNGWKGWWILEWMQGMGNFIMDAGNWGIL